MAMVVAFSPLDLFSVVRLRGLPFNCTDIDIFKFFAGVLDIVDVLLVNKSGRFSGEVFNCFAGSMQVEIAMQRDRQNMHGSEVCGSFHMQGARLV
jgi:RNA recognition motif-containing protein